MPCLVALLALAFPRLAIVLVVIFSDYIGNAYQTTIVPFLGFLFMPLTTLAYALAINAHGSVSGLYLVVLVLAVLADLGMGGFGARANRNRQGRKS
ncbi:MAG: hypothetical protein H6812_13115 [Phycisphaeraceae bacterium]|nr:hypothetical protein [Phycisphaerales bacterium]MCB9844177.1 hypothetical protein [Phycisphaeraceae bacterium]